MLNARKDAAPVSAEEGFVNNSVDFNVNSVPTQNLVINPAQQFKDKAPIVDVRIWMGAAKPSEWLVVLRENVFVSSPSFGLVLKHLLPMSFHFGTPDTADFKKGRLRSVCS